jgi:hypothetical protein
MNSNWTGRAPRTLSQCHFRDDCEAIEHYRHGSDKGAWVVVLVICILAIASAVHLAASL